MSKKRHSTAKTRDRRTKSYARKHSKAKKGSSLPEVKGDDVPKTLMIILLIIFFIATILYLIQGGVAGYDRYPGDVGFIR